MTIGIMQPYFFPYIGYFQLIDSVDIYVNLDHVSFMKRSYMVRNKLNEKQNIGIQVNSGSQNKTCREVTVNFDNKWLHKTLSSIRNLYSKKDNYDIIMNNIVSPNFIEKQISVSEFNLSIIKSICNYLDIETIFIDSSVGMTYKKKGEGLKDICKIYNCDSYINAIGGRSLYDKQNFLNDNIKLGFCKMDDDIELNNPYSSILDVLFNYKKEHIKSQLKKYTIL